VAPNEEHEEYDMLVLIATNELQGTAPDDYGFTVEGELVTPVAAECASGERCGCNRGFPGLASGFATTTAMIADRPGVTDDDLRDAVFDWLDRSGGSTCSRRPLATGSNRATVRSIRTTTSTT
jgi:hypothetical protein